MLKIKSLELLNYAGFNNKSIFNFMDKKRYKPIVVFFGPNGCGKSTGLNAISVLSKAKVYAKRKEEEKNLLLRKMQFHPDYDPNYAGFTKYNYEMEIKAIFENEQKEELIVHIKNDDVIRNDLANLKLENSIFIDADHPINNSKFQIPSDGSDLFLELAEAIYGYKCYLEKPVSAEGAGFGNEKLKEILKIYANNQSSAPVESNSLSRQEIYNHISGHETSSLFFYQDFIIEKGNVKVHYKSMSAGEKKIATLLRNLCDKSLMSKSNIILIDNIELHIYWERHSKMIDKLLKSFPEKQFIVTTHSGTLLKYIFDKFGKDCLFDIEFIKGVKEEPSYNYW